VGNKLEQALKGQLVLMSCCKASSSLAWALLW